MTVDAYSLTPTYRYYTADLITGRIIMEIPFEGVSYERKISAAGSFSGNIPADPDQDHFDLYNSTVPGKHGLYIMRNGVCVWGGIIWSRQYSLTQRKLTVEALEFVSYLNHRVFWKSFTTDTWETTGDEDTIKTFLETLITAMNTDQSGYNDSPYGYLASDVHVRVNNYERSALGVVTLTTEEPHGFDNGNQIYVAGFAELGVTGIDGTWTVSGITAGTPRQFQFSGSTASAITLATVPASAGTHTILKTTADTLTACANVRITTDISTDLDSQFTDAFGDNNPFTFRGSEMKYIGEILRNFAENGVPTRVADYTQLPLATVGTVNRQIARVALNATTEVATITTSSTHGFVVGDSVTITNVGSPFNVTASITAASTNTFTFTLSGQPEDIPEYSVTGVFTKTRFDYFIESSFDAATSTFNNVFKAWLVQKDVNNPSSTASTPELSTLYGPSQFGANNLVFEHPGNIIEINLSESADSASTRTWMVDSTNDLDSGASKYYGAYTNLPYLNENFPILETAITDKDLSVFSDEQVSPHAKEAGYRLAPPIGFFTVSVNGSISPQVGSYAPGDWCVVVPNDRFIGYRLRPPYENRTDVLVRKIRSMKVNVPDFPAFPEVVELELVPEWEEGA